MTKKTSVSLLAAVACLLSVPAASQAAETIGSDLSRAPGNDSLYCGTTPTDRWPCTLISDRQPWEVEIPDEHIITKWTAQLTSGAQVRFRVFKRNADGTFTGAGSSDAVTATRTGVQSFRTHLPVPAGDYTIGLDVLDGTVGAHVDEGFDLAFTDSPIEDGATRAANITKYELLLNAAAESDYDGDGKGDETEDDCTGSDCDDDGKDDPRDDGDQRGRDDDGVPPFTPRGDEYVPTPRKPDTPEVKGPPFTVDTRALLRPDAEGRKGVFELFAENTGSGDASATFEVRAGSKVIGKQRITELESGDDATVKFRLAKKQLKALRRKGKLKLALNATATHADGKTTPIKQDLTVLPGGAKKFDGSYKGPGPIVFVVQGGAIRTVSSEVNAFCPKTNRHQSLSIFAIDGFPALVKPDGSFAADGNGGGQALKYNGKLSLKGKSKGYASAYRFELGVSDGGRYFTDGCTGAINWTAVKTK